MAFIGWQAPTAARELNGRWRLLFTSKPGTNSPIQRTFTSVDAFSIFQVHCIPSPHCLNYGAARNAHVSLLHSALPAAPNDCRNAAIESSLSGCCHWPCGMGPTRQDITLDVEGLPLIVNVVEFGKWGVLRVEAEANTDARPLPLFTPRKGAGLPIFGRSSTWAPKAKVPVLHRPVLFSNSSRDYCVGSPRRQSLAAYTSHFANIQQAVNTEHDAVSQDMRVDFQFSKGLFDFKALPFTIPYPVPFKLLGDETKVVLPALQLCHSIVVQSRSGICPRRMQTMRMTLPSCRFKQSRAESSVVFWITGIYRRDVPLQQFGWRSPISRQQGASLPSLCERNLSVIRDLLSNFRVNLMVHHRMGLQGTLFVLQKVGPVPSAEQHQI